MATTKRVLDLEMRKALMGYVPFSSKASSHYTPPPYLNLKDKTLHPVFEIRPFKQSELMELKKNYASLGDRPTAVEMSAMADKNTQIIRGCLIGWHNLFDAGTGEEIIFKGDSNGGCEAEAWDALPVWLHRDFMEYVRKMSGLTGVEDLGLK